MIYLNIKSHMFIRNGFITYSQQNEVSCSRRLSYSTLQKKSFIFFTDLLPCIISGPYIKWRYYRSHLKICVFTILLLLIWGGFQWQRRQST
jgi:hypothetical protein